MKTSRILAQLRWRGDDVGKKIASIKALREATRTDSGSMGLYEAKTAVETHDFFEVKINTASIKELSQYFDIVEKHAVCLAMPQSFKDVIKILIDDDRYETALKLMSEGLELAEEKP